MAAPTAIARDGSGGGGGEGPSTLRFAARTKQIVNVTSANITTMTAEDPLVVEGLKAKVGDLTAQLGDLRDRLVQGTRTLPPSLSF